MGQDKAWLLYKEKPFIQHIIAALAPLVSEVIVVANNAAYKQLNVRLVQDAVDNCGPLGGLYTGLSHTKTPYNLVLSCDVPLMTTATLSYLLEEYNDELIRIFSVENQWQLLVGLYHKTVIKTAEQLLAKQQLRMMNLLKQCVANAVPCPRHLEVHLRNINTPEDFKKICLVQDKTPR